MIKAETVLTAWDKTLETRDFSHLSVWYCHVWTAPFMQGLI